MIAYLLLARLGTKQFHNCRVSTSDKNMKVLRRACREQVCIDYQSGQLEWRIWPEPLSHPPPPATSPLSWTGAVCLPELSIDPDGPFRHLSIFNQPPPLTQQLLPNWFEIDYHQHYNGSVGQWQVLIKNPWCKIKLSFHAPSVWSGECVSVCITKKNWLYCVKVESSTVV